MAPIVHGLENIYEDQINFVYLDIDDPATDEFKRHFGYRYQPEYYLLAPDGSTLYSWFGFVPPEGFQTVLEETLNGEQTGVLLPDASENPRLELIQG